MTKTESIKKREQYSSLLINQPFSKSREGWLIRDIIIADLVNVANVYEKMWDNNLTNDQSLKLFDIKDGSYEVFVISHQWSWGSGSLLYEKLDKYLTHNTI